MRLFKKTNKKSLPTISYHQAMNCKPVKNANITELRLKNGCFLLSYPLGVKPWMAALIKRFSKAPEKTVNKKLELDTLGSAVWGLLDGNRSVKQVIEEFARIYQLNAKEAETSVTQFLRQLGKRGLIGFRQ